MRDTQKLSMSRFIFQYLIPLFAAALLLVTMSWVSDVRAEAVGETYNVYTEDVR